MAHESAVLRVLLDALERRRCLFWAGNVLVELDRDFDPAEEGVGGVTMVLDDEDFAALKALSARADLPQGFRPQDIEELRVQGEHYRAARDEGDYAAASSSSAPGDVVQRQAVLLGIGAEYDGKPLDARKLTLFYPLSSAPEQVERAREALKTLANPNPTEFENSAYVRLMAAYAREAWQSLDAVSGPPAGDPMPVFTIQAKDNAAIQAINGYRHCCLLRGLADQAREVEKAIEEIEAWRSRNSALCKDPDHEHVPAGPPESDERQVVGYKTKDAGAAALAYWCVHCLMPNWLAGISEVRRSEAGGIACDFCHEPLPAGPPTKEER